MPLGERVAYGKIYSSLRNYDALRLSERDIWMAISGFEGAGTISSDRRFELRALIARARDTDRSITRNWSGMRNRIVARGWRRHHPAETLATGDPCASRCGRSRYKTRSAKLCRCPLSTRLRSFTD